MTERATRATVDRIVDGEQAVLLVERADGTSDEAVVCVGALPEEGRRAGAVYEVTRRGEEVRDLTYLPDETERRRADAQDRLDRLSSPLGEGSRDEE